MHGLRSDEEFDGFLAENTERTVRTDPWGGVHACATRLLVFYTSKRLLGGLPAEGFPWFTLQLIHLWKGQ